MKLSFIWVERYKGFTNFSLNLASDEKFTYEHESHSLQKTNNNNYIAGLFAPTITEITAIVGKNGAGKTNCLELICTILEGSMLKYRTDFLAIVKDDDGKYSIYHNFENQINANFKYSYTSGRNKIKSLKGIFFSNIHDNRKYNFGREIAYVTSNNNYGYRNYGLGRAKGNLISSQIDLISKYGKVIKDEIKISIPTSLGVELYVFFDALDFEEGKIFRSSMRKRIKDIVSSRNKFIHSLKYMFLAKLISTLLSDFGSDFIEYINFNLKDNEPTDVYLEKVSNDIADYISLIIDTHKNDDVIYEKYSFLQSGFSDFREIEDKLHLIDPILNTSVTGYSNYTRYTLKVNEENLKVIKTFNYLFGKRGDIRADWEGISSGSKAYLTLFTMLRESLKNVRSDTLICIDEGDLYLHPSWQIDFLSNLNKMLPNFSNYNIQLVLTSHSPFLLTDLPHSNVVILEDLYDHPTQEAEIRTFGSNIYDLYSSVFFLNK
ncbi:ATP-binding protein, partial [Cronobacter sakazakii]|nr:ATP-binding protein [Cronobacter sakazakii]